MKCLSFQTFRFTLKNSFEHNLRGWCFDEVFRAPSNQIKKNFCLIIAPQWWQDWRRLNWRSRIKKCRVVITKLPPSLLLHHRRYFFIMNSCTFESSKKELLSYNCSTMMTRLTKAKLKKSNKKVPRGNHQTATVEDKDALCRHRRLRRHQPNTTKNHGSSPAPQKPIPTTLWMPFVKA